MPVRTTDCHNKTIKNFNLIYCIPDSTLSPPPFCDSFCSPLCYFSLISLSFSYDFETTCPVVNKMTQLIQHCPAYNPLIERNLTRFVGWHSASREMNQDEVQKLWLTCQHRTSVFDQPLYFLRQSIKSIFPPHAVFYYPIFPLALCQSVWSKAGSELLFLLQTIWNSTAELTLSFPQRWTAWENERQSKYPLSNQGNHRFRTSFFFYQAILNAFWGFFQLCNLIIDFQILLVLFLHLFFNANKQLIKEGVWTEAHKSPWEWHRTVPQITPEASLDRLIQSLISEYTNHTKGLLTAWAEVGPNE